MEVPFYEDEIMPIDSSSEHTMYDKTAMKLDLNATVRSQSVFDNSILTSPDLNLLKLASPELEKLILNCGSLVTPTPQGLKNSAANLSVTEQQELYARGFLEALQKLHQEQGPPGSTAISNAAFTLNQTTSSIGVPTKPVFTQAPANVQPSTVPLATQMLVTSDENFTTVQSYPSNTLSTISTGELPLESVRTRNVTSQIFPQFQSTGGTMNAQPQFQNAAANFGYSNQGQLAKVKVEDSLQVVPGTPPLPPIDLDLQEAVKSERKKLRNRLAASKCRRRKLEKEADLEKKVQELKDKNSGLQSEAFELREQICQLKKQVMKHINEGCKVYLSASNS
ncbi:transcription factor jun-D-like [Actinia tenebrosa]|uniref:Transcription factor jun-D-like n=1 Tax=Actinia tenebrosa TaxID=6105 RepID=A0A6P8H9P5_ACTTE|nr:transcription factor jun-D-like [Actinia tenebrosa]